MNSRRRYFHDDFSTLRDVPTMGGYNVNLDPRNQCINLANRNLALPQHMLLNPINNIVVIPPAPTQVFFNNKQPNHNKRKKKRKKRKQKMADSATSTSEISVIAREEKSDKNTGIINVEDSDESDEVLCIDSKPAVVLVSSDDEKPPEEKLTSALEVEQKKEHNISRLEDDDICFVPNEEKRIEIITIDEEQAKDTPSTSFDSSEAVLPVDQEKMSDFRREIVGTPESTMSNDFLENADLSQAKFDFELHGADFNAKDLTKLQSKQSTEKCETESSASDVSTPMKTVVFNEVPFENATKNIFSENSNLENFADFIVPKRANSSSTSLSLGDKLASSHNERAKSSSSESSSESDYEIDVNKKTRLPSFSSFEDQCLEDSNKNDEMDCTITSEPVASISNIKRSFVDSDLSDSSDDESKVAAVGKSLPKKRKETDEETKNDALVDNTQPFELNSSSDDEPYMVCSSDSDESVTFKTDSFDDDLELTNCTIEPTRSYEPLDETIQKDTYSFDKVWTSDKEKFYKDSWGHENFNVAQVQKTMSGIVFGG